MQKLALSGVLVLAGVLPAFAGFIEARPQTSPDYQAAVAVAQADCEIDISQWLDIVVSLGGTESSALWSIQEMKRAGEVTVDDAAKTIKLKGVLGC